MNKTDPYTAKALDLLKPFPEFKVFHPLHFQQVFDYLAKHYGRKATPFEVAEFCLEHGRSAEDPVTDPVQPADESTVFQWMEIPSLPVARLNRLRCLNDQLTQIAQEMSGEYESCFDRIEKAHADIEKGIMDLQALECRLAPMTTDEGGFK